MGTAVFDPLVLLLCASLLGAQACFGDLTRRELQAADLGDRAWPYRLLRPEVVEPGQRYPLIVFLHGAGERGDDNEKQMLHMPAKMLSTEWRERFPCFLLAPQCPEGSRWVELPWDAATSSPMAEEPAVPLAAAMRILERTLVEEPIDPARVYLTGLSMGGYGAWELAVRRPELFAALAPVCGGGDESAAGRLIKLPVWAFHGAEDPVVPVGRSRRMVAAIRAAGGDVRYTEVPGLGHAAWVPAYGADGVIPWMFEQRRARAPD